jgi:hypothetical protein
MALPAKWSEVKPLARPARRPLLVQMFRPVAAVLAIVMVLAPAFALGDDWSADRLRGRVVQLVDGQWQPLARGMVVPDTRVVRTLATGHVTFVRGEETVELGPDTQIQIYDKAGRNPFTTVKQYYGSVSVEAQVENVQHFAVDTPFLAAVVKGTRFVVTSTKTGSAVRVRRGHVAVEDKADRSHVTLSVGQSAIVDQLKTRGALVVSGSGKLPVVEGGRTQAQAGSSGSGDGNTDSGSGSLVSLGIGGNGGLVDLGVGGSDGSGDLVELSVGGKGLVNLSVGGSGHGGGDGDGQGGDKSGKGSSGSGHRNSDSGGGKLLNVKIGGIHLGL